MNLSLPFTGIAYNNSVSTKNTVSSVDTGVYRLMAAFSLQRDLFQAIYNGEKIVDLSE